MSSPCTNNPDAVIEKIISSKNNADKFDKFVNGTDSETVNLGTGAPTPVLRNAVKQMLADASWAKNYIADAPEGDISLNNATALQGTQPRTLAERFAEVINVKDFGAKGDGYTDDTAALRNIFDYALSLIKGSGLYGVVVKIPAGKYIVSDELFSDEFQEDIWTHSYSGRDIIIRGEGCKVTSIIVSSDWVSGVRNVANGNQRTYGPWANSPSPSILFPIIQDINNGNPLAISLQGLYIATASGRRIGRDPIPFFVRGELDARHSDLNIYGFSNWGEVVFGSYNSNRTRIKVIDCGQQPSECGKVFPNIQPGFTSQALKFNFDKTNMTVTAKATKPVQGYAAGDYVPFFKASHVGKKFFVSNCDYASMPLKTTITAVDASGHTATVTADEAFGTLLDGTGVAGSFTPVTASTTAGSAVVTLSAPVCFGRGARDMIGMMIAIPHAGMVGPSGLNFRSDLYVTRIASCDYGNDTDGYVKFTMTEVAKNSVSGEDFITSAAHFDGCDAKAYAEWQTHGAWNVNDTDWLNCQWENGSNDLDTPNSGSYMFLSSGAGVAVQYVSCKIHGWGPVNGQFGCDGSVIVDNSYGIDFIGVSFTHIVTNKNGCVRITGYMSRVYLTNISFDSWKLPKGYKPFYIDPETPWSKNDFLVQAKNLNFVNWLVVSNLITNIYFLNPSNMNSNDLAHVIRKSDTLWGYLIRLRSTDNLNDLKEPGLYYIGNTDESPENTPKFGAHSIVEVKHYGDWTHQTVTDFDNVAEYTRFLRYANNSWSWTDWKQNGVLIASTVDMQDKTSFVNEQGKARMSFAYNTTNYKLYLAWNGDPTGDWVAADGSGALHPN